MKVDFFLNEFITLGLNSYLNKDKNNAFERHVIECLADIYGEKNITNSISMKEENLFLSLLKMYGLNDNAYINLINAMNKYENYKNESSGKTSLLTYIENILIMMFIYKNINSSCSMSEIGHFENNLLNDLTIIQLHYKCSINPNATREIWNQKKKIILPSITLERLVPEYLDDYTYSLFGTSLEQVKNMDYRMVNELNSYIKSKQIDIDIKEKNSKFKKWNVAISSGSGFVDAVMILSIIGTEISLGLIYLFLHM